MPWGKKWSCACWITASNSNYYCLTLRFRYSPYWCVIWAGWRPQCCCPFCSGSHDRGSQKNVIITKTEIPNHLWCGSPHQQRDHTDLKLCSLFRDDHLTVGRGCSIWSKTSFVTSPSTTSCVLCGSELIHLTHLHPFPAATHYTATQPICGNNKRQSGRKTFTFFLWESCLKCKLTDFHGFAHVTWRISQVSYIPKHKLMPWCLDDLVPLMLKDKYDLGRIWFIFNVDGIKKKRLNILTPNNWCGKRKRCD